MIALPPAISIVAIRIAEIEVRFPAKYAALLDLICIYNSHHP